MYPFLLTFLAGISTMLGTLPIFIKIKNNDKIIALACSFASGVMICISIVDLVPEGIKYLSKNYSSWLVILLTFICMMIGIVISIFLDNTISCYSKKNDLYKVGILSMVVIILHNIPEGIVTFIVSNRSIFMGLSICIAIALHNIPEGISIAIPIYYATNSRIKAVLYTLISAMSELFGAILTYLILGKYVNDTILGIILSITAGIMLQISFNKLLPTGGNYSKNLASIFFLVGFIFMIISLLLNNLIF